MKKKILIVSIIIIIVIVSIILIIPKNKSNDEINYKDTKVSKQTIVNTITSSGEVTSDDETKYLNTYRYFSTIYYDIGSYVKKGSKIVKYTNGTYFKAPCNLVITSYNVPDSKEKIRSNNYVSYKCMDTLKMSITIDESDINKVSVNQSATITLNYDESKNYDGKVTSINQIGNYSSSGTKYTAVIEFENDGNIKLGMSGSVSIEVESATDVIAVPIEAVQTKGNEKYVMVVNNNEVSNVVITTGISNSAYVEVKTGLDGSETVRMIDNDSSSNNKMFNMNGNFDFKDMERPNNDMKPSSNEGQRQR